MKFGKKDKNSMRSEFDSKHVFDEKYLMAKIKSYNGKVNTIFGKIK